MENPELILDADKYVSLNQTEKLYDDLIKKSDHMSKIFCSLDSQIDQTFEESKCDSAFSKKIDRVFTAIENLISKDFLLLKYGSTVNGLSNKSNSDLDLTILIPDMFFDHNGYLIIIEKKLAKDKRRYEIIRHPSLDSSGFIL